MPSAASIINTDLQVLVKELSKNNPDIGLIKSKTNVLGIPYSSDLIILMSEVLVHLSKSGHLSQKIAKKTKEKNL